LQRIFSTPAIMVCALPGLVACQSGENLLAKMVAGPIPVEAFQPTVDSSRLIFVVPVAGMPDPARLVLADAIATSLRDANKPAIIAEKVNALGSTIAGRIIEVNELDTVAWVTMVWELRAPYGTAVAEYSQQVVVDSGLWKSGSGKSINVLFFDAGPKTDPCCEDQGKAKRRQAHTVEKGFQGGGEKEQAGIDAGSEKRFQPSNRRAAIGCLETPSVPDQTGPGRPR